MNDCRSHLVPMRTYRIWLVAPLCFDCHAVKPVALGRCASASSPMPAKGLLQTKAFSKPMQINGEAEQQANDGHLAIFAPAPTLNPSMVLDKNSTCSIKELWMPPIILTLLLAIVLFLLFNAFVDFDDPVRHALSIGVYSSFQENLFFTLILVNALDFMKHFQADPVLSGSLIGIHKIGTSVGFLLLFLGLRWCPGLWRRTAPIILTGATLQILAASAFLVLSLVVEGPNRWPIKPLLVCLMSARFVQGLGGGLQVSLAWHQAAHLVSGWDRSLQNMRVFLAGCLGLGAGPLLTSVTALFASAIPCSAEVGFWAMFPLVGLLPWTQCCIYIRRGLPTLDDLHDVGKPPATSSNESVGRKVVVVVLCLVLLIFRNIALAALEVGNAEALETIYGWNEIAIGLGTFLIVFSVVPVQLVFEMCKGLSSAHTWTQLMLWISILAASGLLLQDAGMFTLAAATMFPMVALSSGLVMGLMQENTLTEGSCLDLNTATLLGIIMADFMGRGGGPILARFSLAKGGQEGFALAETTLCTSSLILYHLAAYTHSTKGLHGESEHAHELR